MQVSLPLNHRNIVHRFLNTDISTGDETFDILRFKCLRLDLALMAFVETDNVIRNSCQLVECLCIATQTGFTEYESILIFSRNFNGQISIRLIDRFGIVQKENLFVVSIIYHLIIQSRIRRSSR